MRSNVYYIENDTIHTMKISHTVEEREKYTRMKWNEEEEAEEVEEEEEEKRNVEEIEKRLNRMKKK